MFQIRFYSSDWFHLLVDVDSARMIGGMMLFYPGIILTFAVFSLVIARGSTSKILLSSLEEFIVRSSFADKSAGTIIAVDDSVQVEDDT